MQEMKRSLMRLVIAPMAILALTGSAWSQATLPLPDQEARLERLSAKIGRNRIEFHAPGAALAIVRGDDVIFARGFGLADVENQMPATPETPFFIGSTTKAFTSTLSAQNAGRVIWGTWVISLDPTVFGNVSRSHDRDVR